MNPVETALWFIENHFGKEISLDDIAGVAGVSRFHLSHIFGMATGRSVMNYVRSHISMISRTHYTIWATWAEESGHAPAEMLNFERYDERFDPITGNGVVEIWVPIKTQAWTDR